MRAGRTWPRERQPQSRFRDAAPVTLLLGVMLVALLSGCGSSPNSAKPGDARASRVVMTSASNGYAVWPSGARWIVIGTTDGWRTVVNRTPMAVPTDGGLVVLARQAQLWVGVLAHQLLRVSPVLQAGGAARTWVPSQLPGALLPTSSSLARSAHALWAVLADGRVAQLPDGSQAWSVLGVVNTEMAHLGSPARGIDFADGAHGLIWAADPAGHPVLWSTTNEGATWVHQQLADSAPGQVLAACHVDELWLVPVAEPGRLVLYSSSSPHGPWTKGGALAAASPPVVACAPHSLWAAVPRDGGGEIYVTVDTTGSAAWVDRGALASQLTSLAPVSESEAWATSDDATAVFAVNLPSAGAGKIIVSRTVLPQWVTTVGGAAMSN